MAKMSHPKGLMVLFFTEMWERFSYYGMRALLVLYLTSKMIHNGFGMDRTSALHIYAIFTGLVYLTPIIGGLLADKILGQRKAMYIGAIVMALGQFSLAFSEFGEIVLRTHWLNIGLGLLIVGNGFFKPNISTMVGQLYTDNDPRKDSAFTIFYMGVNLGALAAPFIAGWLGEKINWFYGFAAAGIGMLISTVWFYLQTSKIGNAGMPPKTRLAQPERTRLGKKDNFHILLYIISIVVLVISGLNLWSLIPDKFQTIIIRLLIVGGIGYLSYIIITNTKGKNEWSRIVVILVLALFNIFFWAGFEQAGGTFNLFAKAKTNLGILPASLFQSINPLFIVLLGAPFSLMWLNLGKRNKEPRTPVKFGLGLLLLGLGFVVMSLANSRATGGNLVSPLWLLTVYFMHTCGELCLSPIGLSMITKLAPQKIVSVMMGVWFGSMALANYLAGVLESILHNLLPDMQLFHFLVITSFIGAVILLAISPILNRLMKGIH